MAPKGQQLDLTSAADSKKASQESAQRFLGVHFACCDVYARVYINHDQTAYVGHCPRCAKRVQMRVGAEGTAARFFTVY